MARPRKYDSPEEFDNQVDLYVQECKSTEEPITWTGMALALGFFGRQEIDNYAGYDGFSDSVKRAKAIVENAYEKRLATTTPTGSIFALKNMGWRDQKDINANITARDATGLSDAELEAIASGSG